MAHFKIEIEGDHDGTLGWTTKVYDDDRQGNIDFSYLYSIANELEGALKKISSSLRLQLKDCTVISNQGTTEQYL